MSADVHDPKYLFCSGDRIFHRDSGYYIPRGEPVMVLRGKDVTVLAAIIGYIKALLDMPTHPTVDGHLASSSERLLAIYEYQTDNAGVVGVGCSQKHHGGSEKILLEACTLLQELGYITQ